MLIGVDIGTSNVKAVAVDAHGFACAEASRQTDIITPQAGWFEQDPELLFQKVLAVLHEVMQDTAVDGIEGIVFSTAMHGLLALDAKGQPLNNIWLWSDLRAEEVAQKLRNPGAAGMDIYRRTGVPIHPMSPLCKLIWMREQQPTIFKSAHKFLGIKSYIWYRLSGQFTCDFSCASASGLMNIRDNIWDSEALALAGIKPDHLPELVSTHYIGKISGGIDLPQTDIPLIIGASDGALANLGSGATAPGQMAVTIGTSAAIRGVSNSPVLYAAMHNFCYHLDHGRWIVGGASNNGTNVLEWLRKNVFRSSDSAEAFANQAAEIAPGAEGLIFLPYVFGERAPLWDAQARGAFLGLSAQHRQAHFVRAAMEGVVLNLKVIADSMPRTQPLQSLHAGGGFSKNPYWVQMLADIFQVPVLVQENMVDSSVAGAIQVGRMALGLKAIPQTQSAISVTPNEQYATVYSRVFELFKKAQEV